ncbi:TetR/AcrR family transcriptional regulator [Pectobacterium carotovorum]|uniref:TetR/AcrR family transcriptional regulator n=1 Tax=Pectobacterium TaxID=122277 RepID=UPI000E24D170|nr:MULTISPECIES: TetR family transcriptional regulator [Pectobacterium]MDQ5892135.1 TetR/AcrR family transcriptional regulator, transcriptional repressor for nem operon [Pseudomonadota bacterium]QQG27536.1 TetR family transcriptional regulator [Pectobacterium carotovorum]MBE5203186.1 TetR family transcriptional regulator [Pectobacterium quasiaquaticum]MBE5209387.1 TetR family transcriptional regulator [Pectobacterium quasiaquaticum]MCH5050492.1 TetR family transcriptional regulator [Pectobacte
MARVSKQQMERNREEIIQVSSQLFRERGLNGVSVNDLMAAAGLTHGGFYGHFASKDELAAIASRKALEDSRSRWQEITQHAGQHDLQTMVEHYLSPAHRDGAKDGCALTALASDIARESEDKPIREVYLSGVRAMLDRLESLSTIEDKEQRRLHALAQFALLSGALTLARATAGDPLSDDFLIAAKKALLGDA